MLAVVRKLWQTIREAFGAGERQQVTLRGASFLMAMLSASAGAYLSGHNLAFLLLASMIAAVLVSTFLSRLTIAGLKLEFLLPDHLSARQPVSGRVVLENEKWAFASYSIHLARVNERGGALESVLYFPCIPRGSRLETPIQITFAQRGLIERNRFLFSTKFPFGFTERRIEVTVAEERVIYPNLDAQPGFKSLLNEIVEEIETHFSGRGTDFYRIRPYEMLDSASRIHWKASAHTGELQVQEFTRNDRMAVTLWLDVNAPIGVNESFEKAIECCAYLAWELSSRDIAVRLHTQEAQLRFPEDASVYDILRYLALVSPRQFEKLVVSHESDSYSVLVAPDGADVPDGGDFRVVRVGDLSGADDGPGVGAIGSRGQAG